MTLIRPDGTEGGSHDLRPGENKLGRSFGQVFENDGYLSPIHAQLDIRGGGAMIHDLESLNGVFVKMTQEEELTSGQIIRIGQELLRFEVIARARASADGTELMGSPNPGYWGKLTVIIGATSPAPRSRCSASCTLGRERGRHQLPTTATSLRCTRVTLRDGRVFLADLALERYVHQGQRRTRARQRLVRAARPAAVPAEPRLNATRPGHTSRHPHRPPTSCPWRAC
jgi:hypothetical protein